MSSYTQGASVNWQYEFWPTGERYAKTNLGSSASELYIPRGGDVATEYTRVGGGSPVFSNRYAQGTGIDQKQVRISADASIRRHYLGDQVGTVSVTLADDGAVAESSLKDAWGVQVAGAMSERYGYAQREHDLESGLIYMRNRMYDSRTGRLTQDDPIRVNRPFKNYAYASNNPISRIDPMGLDDEDLSSFTQVDPASLGANLGAWAFQRGKTWYWRPGAQHDAQYRDYLVQRRAAGMALDQEYLDYLRAERGNTVVAEGMTVQQILALDVRSKVELSIRNPGMFGRGGLHEIFSEAEYRAVPGVIRAEVVKGIAILLGKSIAEGALGGGLKIMEAAVGRKAAIEIAKKIGARAHTARTLRDVDELAHTIQELRKAAGGLPEEQMAARGAVALEREFTLKRGRLIQGLKDLTDPDAIDAFAESGYTLAGHFRMRLRDPRLEGIGVRTLADVQTIMRKGIPSTTGDITSFVFQGAKIVTNNRTRTLITITPD
jgi:RHS repeat-associated protein